jgi:hypothetical protein
MELAEKLYNLGYISYPRYLILYYRTETEIFKLNEEELRIILKE